MLLFCMVLWPQLEKGHLTDKAIIDVLGVDRTIIWNRNFLFFIQSLKFTEDKHKIIYSLGGGKIGDENTIFTDEHIYPHKNDSKTY